MKISIRKFEKADIPNKVKWINDPKNNVYLHYDIPLKIDKTEIWFERNKDRNDRYDAVIEADGVPVGLIGLLSIDRKNSKAEYYVTIGERNYLGKGVALRASKLLLDYAFGRLGLNRVYLYTEVDNIAAIRSYERIGFRREGMMKQDLFSKGRFVDRYVYGISKRDFCGWPDTPIHRIDQVEGNGVYIKREDLLPFSFGGNKARKAQLFMEEMDRGNYDCIVTYGSSSSNHCRVIANQAAVRGIKCHIISPEETMEETCNTRLMRVLGVEVTICPVSAVSNTIERKISMLREQGGRPYFIAGGGHGSIGTQAYVDCYEEIRQYERVNHIHFDYIFHASGTGTTQAGLVCGQLLHREERKIVGISIARKNPRGRGVVLDSIREYLLARKADVPDATIEKATIFADDYVGGGYGSHSDHIAAVIQNAIKRYGIPLDETYTGKAFAGMLDYIKKEQLTGKNILFIHTGGTPLFFDHLSNIDAENY